MNGERTATQLTDPPAAGDEFSTLMGFLDYQRDVLRRKTEGLSADQLNRALSPTTMTLGGLLKHVVSAEHFWLTEIFLGREATEPWASVDWKVDRDWDWHSAATDSPEYLRELFDAQVIDSDRIVALAMAGDGLAVGATSTETPATPTQDTQATVTQPIATGGLGQLAAEESNGRRVSLRWILVHLIEEYARHLGHADLLREAIDGSVGD